MFIAIILASICCFIYVLNNGDDEKSESTKAGNTSEELASESSIAEINISETPAMTKTIFTTKTPTLSYKALSQVNSNVRSEPGLEHPVIKGLKVNEEFRIYGRNQDSTWFLIDPLDQLWVSNSVITVDIPLDSFSVAPTITPTLSPTPTITLTPRPSATLVPAVSILEIYNNLQEMTELQFKEYKNTLVGKPVRENVKISNVSDDGKETLSSKWSPFIFNFADFGVVVLGVPHDIAIELNGGDEFFFGYVANLHS